MHEGAVIGQCACVALIHGRHRQALIFLDDAIDIARDAGDQPRVAIARGDQGCAALGLGDMELAAAAFTEELEICRSLGYFELLEEGALGLAAVAARTGDSDRAAVLAGAGTEAFARAQMPIMRALEQVVARHIDGVRRRTGGRGAPDVAPASPNTSSSR